MAATYQKLKSGEWGIRSTSAVAAGERVTVTKKDGTVKTETVVKVLWSGDGIWLCAITGADRPPAPAQTQTKGRRSRRDEDDECEVCGRNKYTCGHCVGW